MKNSKLPKKNACISCKNCINICKHKAITIKTDFLGNRYPFINNNRCTNCGLCEKVCPILSIQKLKNDNIISVQACIAEKTILMNSASGGFATQLSEIAIEKKAIVVGAAFTNYPSCNHIIVENKDNLRKLKGSKYVYSELNDVMPQLALLQKKEKTIIFIGLPCQVAAAKSYLKNEKSTYFIDLLCHGTCPNFIFEKYNNYLSWRLKSKVINYNFRGQKEWKGYNVYQNPIAQTMDNHLHLLYKWDKWFLTSFLNGRAYYKRCYHCKFVGKQRVGDITIGDFWGIGVKIPFSKDTKYGISAVLINNNKGEYLFNIVKDRLAFYEERSYEELAENNQTLTAATPIPHFNIIYHIMLKILPTKLLLLLHIFIYYSEKIIFSLKWRFQYLIKICK